MFKKFCNEEVSGQNQVKASVQRKIRQSIAEEYPGLELVLDDLLPKKSPLIVAKCPNHLNLVVVNNVPLFFNIRDGPYMPTLRLLHQYPNIMKKLQVDRGAIKFVLSGANIMCPGLTSPGGALDDEVEAETPVAIMAEGKQHALAIGFTKMSAKDIVLNLESGSLVSAEKRSTKESALTTCTILMMAFGRWSVWIECDQNQFDGLLTKDGSLEWRFHPSMIIVVRYKRVLMCLNYNYAYRSLNVRSLRAVMLICSLDANITLIYLIIILRLNESVLENLNFCFFFAYLSCFYNSGV